MIPVGRHDTTPSPAPSRVAGYMRVSTEEQRERQSIETQRQYAERHTFREGIEVVDWYADDGVSGTIPMDQRPEGSRLLRDASAGRFGTLLVYKLNRLGRD